MKNIKTKWIEVLQKEENFKELELNSLILKNGKILTNLMLYKNKLLEQKNCPSFTENYTIEDIEQWFLEPISERQFDYIKECKEHNNWTMKELWTVCRDKQVSITTMVKCRK